MSKPRADRLNLREVDARVARVAHDTVVTRDRILKLEKENATLRESIATLTKTANALKLPDGYYESNGDVFDRRYVTFDGHRHVGIIDRGKFVPDVPKNTVVGEDGSVYLDKPIPPFGHQRIGCIADGQFVDERDKLIEAAREESRRQELARVARIHEENARIQKERQGIWKDPHGILRIGADGQEYVPNADPKVEAVMRAQQREHRAFLESNGVENLRPLDDD